MKLQELPFFTALNVPSRTPDSVQKRFFLVGAPVFRISRRR